MTTILSRRYRLNRLRLSLLRLLGRIRLGEWHLDVQASGFRFDPRDLWIGAYWDRSEGGYALDPWTRPGSPDYRRLGGILVTRVDVYVCLLPMLPLRLAWVRRRPIREPETWPASEILDTEAEGE